MKICPKCLRQYESGNFCENCENEDGSPVKLEEKDVTAEGFMKEDIFHITKIAPCLTEHKES